MYLRCLSLTKVALNNGKRGTFDIKSNYFVPVTTKKQNSFAKVVKRVMKCKKRVPIIRSKTTWL